MDTSFAPTGEVRLRAILDGVVAEGDGAESGSLEAKSDINLSERLGVAKVAKFILGMANRMPAAAERRFEGYAVMVLGAEKGAALGIPRGVEAHDLNASLTRYLGPAAPRWDLYRLPVEDNREVLFVIVDPPQPGDPLYLCHHDFQPDGKANTQHALRNGATYVRDHSSTRHAKAPEVQALIERGRASAAPHTDVELTVGGAAVHLGGASDLLDEWLRNNAENYREKRKTADAEETPPSNFGSLTWPSTFAGGTLSSPKPPRPVENVITRWETKTRTGWTNSMTTLAGAVGHPVTFSAVNSAKGFLSNPLMIVTIEGAYGVEDDRATDIERDAVLPSVESRRRDPGIVPVQAAMRHLRPIAAQREMQWTTPRPVSKSGLRRKHSGPRLRGHPRVPTS